MSVNEEIFEMWVERGRQDDLVLSREQYKRLGGFGNDGSLEHVMMMSTGMPGPLNDGIPGIGDPPPYKKVRLSVYQPLDFDYSITRLKVVGRIRTIQIVITDLAPPQASADAARQMVRDVLSAEEWVTGQVKDYEHVGTEHKAKKWIKGMVSITHEACRIKAVVDEEVDLTLHDMVVLALEVEADS